MPIGLTLTKTDLDTRVGNLSLQILGLLDQFNALVVKLASLTDTDLTNMGYTTDDVASIRKLAADTTAMLTLFTGSSTQAELVAPYNAAYDYRVTIRLFAGLGF